MRIGLVVDAVCELPENAREELNIEVMPIEVHVGGLHFLDEKDPHTIAWFYRERLLTRGGGSTVPIPVADIKRMFLERLVLQYDSIFFLTTASSRSAIFTHAMQAAMAISYECKAIREAAGIPGPFLLRVIDTQVIVGAQTISAMAAAHMIREGATTDQIEKRLNELIPQVYGYMIPSDLGHVRRSSIQRGEAAIGWLPYLTALAFDLKPVLSIHQNVAQSVAVIRRFENANSRLLQFGIKRIRAGLLLPLLSVAYSGDITNIEKIAGYNEFREEAVKAGVRVITTQMGVVAGMYLGENVVGMAFAAADHCFE